MAAEHIIPHPAGTPEAPTPPVSQEANTPGSTGLKNTDGLNIGPGLKNTDGPALRISPEDLITRAITYIQTLRPATRRTYHTALYTYRAYLTHLALHDSAPVIDDITPAHIAAYIHWMADDRYTPATIRAYITTLRAIHHRLYPGDTTYRTRYTLPADISPRQISSVDAPSGAANTLVAPTRHRVQLPPIAAPEQPAWYALHNHTRQPDTNIADTLRATLRATRPDDDAWHPRLILQRRDRHGHLRPADSPLLRHLILIRTTTRRLDTLRRDPRYTPLAPYTGAPGPDGHRRPRPIPARQVEMFRLVLDILNGHPHPDTLLLPDRPDTTANATAAEADTARTDVPTACNSADKRASAARTDVPEARQPKPSTGAEPSDSGAELRPDAAPLRPGTRVRVIAGPFQGLEGTIVRIRRDRRLLIRIPGHCALATPHIPAPLLQPLP